MTVRNSLLASFVKEKRRRVGLTQIELASKAGVGVRLIRDIEQGKESFQTVAVNKVIKLFGACLGPVTLPRDTEQ